MNAYKLPFNPISTKGLLGPLLHTFVISSKPLDAFLSSFMTFPKIYENFVL